MKQKKTKKDIAFEERMTKQRAKRGYADIDVWNVYRWFYEIISPMLKQLANTGHGFQTLDEKGNYIDKDHLTDNDTEIYAKRWKDTLLHMAFLADEMNEKTCSMKNPYEKDWRRIQRTFEKKWGEFGRKLLTEEEKKDAKETENCRMYFPEDDPIHGDEYRKVWNQYYEYSKKIDKYQDKCKNEFFKLFSKYFWDLWD